MDLFFLFLNPKRFFERKKRGNYIFSIILSYLILSIILFFSARYIFGMDKKVTIGIIVQIVFNITFIFFLSLFIKVFLKIFGVNRDLITSIEDGFLISLPSFLLFTLMFYLFRLKFLSLSYPLIYFFSFPKDASFPLKALFFFYFPPRILLFLYTIFGVRYLYSLEFKKTLLFTILIYFIFFLTYIF